MSFFGKTYKFVKQENFDGFLKSAGMPDERVAKILEAKPEQKLTKDGDTYTLVTVSPVGTNEVKFKSGVEFDDVLGPEKKPIKSTYVVDGNTVTQTIKAKEINATIKREFNGDDLVLTATRGNWDGTAKVFFKA